MNLWNISLGPFMEEEWYTDEHLVIGEIPSEAILHTESLAPDQPWGKADFEELQMKMEPFLRQKLGTESDERPLWGEADRHGWSRGPKKPKEADQPNILEFVFDEASSDDEAEGMVDEEGTEEKPDEAYEYLARPIEEFYSLSS
jgi:hypothetical protein